MITESFYVKGSDRLLEVKTFIREKMPTARFDHNPIDLGNGHWNIKVSYDATDINKLGQFLERYVQIDFPTSTKKNWFKKLFGL